LPLTPPTTRSSVATVIGDYLRLRPPLFAEMPAVARVAAAVALPVSFGLICGLILGPSAAAFLALQVVALGGGFVAGLEHDRPSTGVIRGLWGGGLLGTFILVGHALAGGDDHGLLPPTQALLPVLTMTLGALSGAAGARVRARQAEA
jgi:hypothetical protein